MSDHPYEERARGLIGVKGPVAIGPGKYPDGQNQEGITHANIHRGERPAYDSPEGHAHREQLRERPSAPTKRR
jgi:hypothetical protein